MFRPACILLHIAVAVSAAAPSVMRKSLPFLRALALLLPMVLFFSGMNSPCSAQDATVHSGPDAAATQIHPAADIAQQEENSAEYRVFVSGNTVSLAAREIAVDKILAEIGRQKLFKLFISPEFTSYTVTDHFDDIPIEKALERLMRGSSYSVVYGGSTSPQSIQELHVLPSRLPQGQQQAIKAPVFGHSREELLHALELSALPDSMKVALRRDATGNTVAAEEVLPDRTAVIQQLIRKMESSGAGNTAVAGQLRKQIGEGESE